MREQAAGHEKNISAIKTYASAGVFPGAGVV